MTTAAVLMGQYDYVYTRGVVSDANMLLKLDLSPTGSRSTSVTMIRETSGRENLMQLKGLGKHLWNGIDAQEYVRKLRNEWDR